jgi:putative transposase
MRRVRSLRSQLSLRKLKTVQESTKLRTASAAGGAKPSTANRQNDASAASRVIAGVSSSGENVQRPLNSYAVSVGRGLRTPELAILDGAPGLEKALATLWSGVPVQRCTVHKHRNLLAHAPDRLREEISADTPMPRRSRRSKQNARLSCKWRLKCRAVADSLEEVGDKFFTSRSSRRANGNRSEPRIPSNACTKSSSGGSAHRFPSAETAAMLFWALLESNH